MNPSCYICAEHNLKCNGILSGTCYRFRPIGSKRSPEIEELKSQLDRIEKKIDDLLSCPISAQEERANRGEDAKCDRIISDWKNKYNPELKEMFDPDEPDINHTDWN